MLELTLEIVAATLLGGKLAGRADHLVDAVMTALHVVVAKAQQPLPIPDSWPTRGNRRLRASMAVLDAAVEAVITARRKAEPGTDTLWLLITAMDEGLATAGEVRDEVVTLIVAGHETVAATLTWTWVLLAQHPEAEQRVHAEVDGLPDPGRGGWDAEVVEQLPFTRAVVDECLRLYPPAWVITRRSLEPDVLGGFDLPAGATVIVSPYAVQRDAQWWPNPDRFDPERFLGETSPSESGDWSPDLPAVRGGATALHRPRPRVDGGADGGRHARPRPAGQAIASGVRTRGLRRDLAAEGRSSRMRRGEPLAVDPAKAMMGDPVLLSGLGNVIWGSTMWSCSQMPWLRVVNGPTAWRISPS